MSIPLRKLSWNSGKLVNAKGKGLRGFSRNRANAVCNRLRIALYDIVILVRYNTYIS